ncbi:MAG: nitronate monooxygenase family protein [Pelistega sp.]|nr:nitronate monooxygenase family protein [Pelistega sp.]
MIHPITQQLYSQMGLPVICSPMFIISNPTLLIEQCKNGIIGSMPALNARPSSQLDEWLDEISSTLKSETNKGFRIAPYAINQIIHASNTRLDQDLALCEKYKVPLIITSLSAPNEITPLVHQWGGLVFHDVTTIRHAEKAIEAGVDGLILVTAGAGGHAGTLNPFALLAEVRKFFDGPIALAGAISSGRDILAARVMGADFVYMGTRFIVSKEANASASYQQMIVDSSAKDIIYTPFFTGIPGNYLRPSIIAAGLDPEKLHLLDKNNPDVNNFDAKAWKDIWGAGQGIGSIKQITSASEIICQLKTEYQQAKAQLTHLF